MAPWTFDTVIRNAGLIPLIPNPLSLAPLKGAPLILDQVGQNKLPKLIEFKNLFEKKNFVMIYFWSEDCENCMETIEESTSLDKYNPILFFPLHIDNGADRRSLQKALRNINFDGQFGFDIDGIIAERLAVTSVPAVYLISKNFNAIGYNPGHVDIKSNGFEILYKYIEINLTSEMVSRNIFSLDNSSNIRKTYSFYNEAFSILSVLALTICIAIGIKKRLFWL